MSSNNAACGALIIYETINIDQIVSRWLQQFNLQMS